MSTDVKEFDISKMTVEEKVSTISYAVVVNAYSLHALANKVRWQGYTINLLVGAICVVIAFGLYK